MVHGRGGAVQGLGRAGLYGCLILATLLVLGGCGTTAITPPPRPLDPVPVFVLDHGRHTSLVLTAADGSLHRYAYGDWRYYAERDTSPWSALAALFWPTQGALGHRSLPGPPTAEAVERQVRVAIRALHVLQVERHRAQALHARLRGIIEDSAQRLEAPEVDLVFVPHPRHYSLAHNSNQAVADWLSELGCAVSRRPVLSGWRIEAAPP